MSGFILLARDISRDDNDEETHFLPTFCSGSLADVGGLFV